MNINAFCLEKSEESGSPPCKCGNENLKNGAKYFKDLWYLTAGASISSGKFLSFILYSHYPSIPYGDYGIKISKSCKTQDIGVRKMRLIYTSQQSHRSQRRTLQWFRIFQVAALIKFNFLNRTTSDSYKVIHFPNLRSVRNFSKRAQNLS